MTDLKNEPSHIKQFTDIETPNKNVATFSGGGVMALITVGIFHSIVTKNPSIKFDMCFGVSGGSLAALVLSYFTNDYIKGIEYIKSKKFEENPIYSLSLNPFSGNGLLSLEPLRKISNECALQTPGCHVP